MKQSRAKPPGNHDGVDYLSWLIEEQRMRAESEELVCQLRIFQ